MATDAEITLKFRAEIQEALKAIKQLRDEIEKIKAAGGFLSPEDIALISEMKAKLDEYTRTVRELQIEYYRLQQRGSEMSVEFFAQVTNLRKQIMELQAQMSTLNDRLADQGIQIDSLKKKVKELKEEHRRTDTDGTRTYRSLRTAIGHFIVNLAKGKLAVRELGMALKGLAYSTVILAAISTAMEGIGWAWEKIKGAFGQSKEAMREAEQSAENAKRKLEEARQAAIDAQEAFIEARKKLTETDEKNALKLMIEQSIDALRQENIAAQEVLDTIKQQAEAEATKRAMAAEWERHQYAMQKLELDKRHIRGELDDKEYSIAVEQLGYEEKTSVYNRKQEELNSKVKEAERIAQELEGRLNELQTKAFELDTKTAEFATDTEIDTLKKKLDDVKASQKEVVNQYNEANAAWTKYTSQRTYKEIKEKEERVGWDLLLPTEQLTLNKGVRLQKEKNEADNERIRYGKIVDAMEKELEAAQATTKERDINAAKLKELNSEIDTLTQTTKTAREKADDLAKGYEKAAAQIDQAKEIEKSEMEERISVINERGYAKQRKEADKAYQTDRNNRYKANDKIREKAEELAVKAKAAAATTNSKDDDARVLQKIQEASDEYGKAFEEYFAQQDGVLEALNMLQAVVKQNTSKLGQYKEEIESLKKRIKQNETAQKKRNSKA